jgi:HAE1 family hydrophobic/amphiphilic exporter-1/multidrug efflux pump
VLKTLLEAMVLVILVVYLFLGNVRATFIPMLAVPVSLVGTFAAFIPLGFTVNTLTLFGLVLAIGIVVDDAIVVVEAVEHHIEHGLSPLAATEKAMEEVSGPVIGIALVLTAVFVPVAFMGGLTGELYRQFAITLSVSVLLSALVALTLTPALCQMMLKPRKPSNSPIAMFLGAFNRWFERFTGGYLHVVKTLIRRSAFSMMLLAAIMAGAWGLLEMLPSGFVPSEDQGVVMASISLPDGASVERTDTILRRGEEFLKKQAGVRDVITMGGMNLLTGAYSSNNGSYIITLDDWSERHGETLSVKAIVGQLQRELFSYPEALGIAFVPPPIPGLGTAGGFQFELQDRKGGTPQELEAALRKLMGAAVKEPALASLYSGYKTSVPIIRLDLNRDKAKEMGVPLKSIFDNLQMYLGGLQVNDFNRFGRTYKVMIQAEPEFRLTPDNISGIYVRAGDESMIPLGTLASLDRTSGPDILQRFNLFRTAEISGGAAPGFSSGDALAAMEAVAARELPEGFGFEWTGMAYQEKQASGTQAQVFILAMVFVFLILAALYENWAIPFGVLLGLPLGIFGAFLGTWVRGLINDVYVQIGLIMLLGLAAKNAILIVEFAKMKREQEGMGIVEAALEGARLRFRPILMTSFAFILGVVPLMLAGGAGSAARHSLGTAVFSGMSFATALGVLLIPVLYVVVERLVEKLFPKRREAAAVEPASTGGHA